MFALTFVEVDIDVCGLNYGVAPCSAVLGVKSDRKCFNTIKTCQARADFTNKPVTLRFAVPTDDLPPDIDALPCIEDVSFSPATISLGENLGIRATLSVTFSDILHSDTGPGFDPYWRERGYDPYRQGTLWGRFRARQPYLFGRNIRLIRGALGQPLDQMETRHFILESFEGPTPDGTYTLKAKDALVMASGDRAQAPRMSNGFLVEAITADATTATLSPAGIGDVEYPASGLVSIGGKEVMSFTRAGDVLTFTGRGLKNTVAEPHDAQDRVQVCLEIIAQTPAAIIALLEQNYASVAPGLIPLPTWEGESSAFYRRLLSRTIAEPTAVEKLIAEVIQQAQLTHYWDDVGRQLRFGVLRQISTDTAVFDEDAIMAGSLDIREQPDRRTSQVWIYFAPINPLKKVDDADNYRSCLRVIDLQAEGDYGTPAIKKIFAPWIPAFGRQVAQRTADIQLGRFRDPPRRFSFSLSRTGGITPVLGRGYMIEAGVLQQDTGEPDTVPIQITRLTPKDGQYDVEAEEMRFISFDDGDLGNKTLIIDANTYNLNLRSAYDQFYPAPVDGDVVTVIIEDGVIVGSRSALLPAVDVGDWPEGVVIDIKLYGRIQGRGGDGGGTTDGAGLHRPGDAENRYPTAGGPALYVRYPINISGGQIWGGGGGGGVYVGEVQGNYYLGLAGGGGQGQDGGMTYPIKTISGTNMGTSGNSEAPGSGGNQGTARGGNGGGAGQPGGDANGRDRANFKYGGAAGTAIDGISFVNVSGADIRGPQIN
ncbi:hypothetical protein [Terrihabitans sp. B22-R8]|uniref:hypothetical protein n=1 Tax=Terrihabitans sp. B22-R8 TaxID=3425128 RepID=UPI00403C4238